MYKSSLIKQNSTFFQNFIFKFSFFKWKEKQNNAYLDFYTNYQILMICFQKKPMDPLKILLNSSKSKYDRETA